MKFGLRPHEFEILAKGLIEPLKLKGISLWIFGSRARGDFKKFSDIDILYDGLLTLSELSDLREKLEESDLPYKVDLVNLSDVAESYKMHIMKDRIRL